jgi:hypothetical protein
MAWPIYALVVVNQRVRLGPPLGDRVDTFIENTIKSRTVPCFIFQGTALASGLALVYVRSESFQPLLSSPALALKFALLLVIMGVLAYVHFAIQPQIDSLFGQSPGPVEGELASRIGALRSRRKRLASFCMFVVLTVAMLGVQLFAAFPIWLVWIFIVAIALFTWRTYATEVRYGWV